MNKKYAVLKDALTKEWKLVIEKKTKDMAIFTIDNEEVLGVSGQIRVPQEIMNHIVDLHNDKLNQKKWLTDHKSDA
jgi:hypothetical protein